MTQEVIDIGVNADDGTGDSLYEAGQKINNNFTDLFAKASVEADIKFFGNNITSRLSNADIFVHPSGTGNVLFPSIKKTGTTSTSSDKFYGDIEIITSYIP